MGQIAIIPTEAAVEAAWERYQALAIAISCDPALLADRDHMEAMARAERAWKTAFLAGDSQ